MRKKLIEARKEKSLTQKEVTDLVNKSRTTYTMHETGMINPPYKIVLKFKSLFEYNHDDLFENELFL